MTFRSVGMISGTSFDAIEVAIADFEQAGETLTLTPIGTASIDLPRDLTTRIAAVLPPAATTMEDIAHLDADLGREFGAAARQTIDALADGHADVVCSHGQTVFHWIEDGHARGDIQLGSPAWIAEATGCPVISDVRNRDIAAGGHGAPLVAILDQLLILHGQPGRAALNLGGISNITVIDKAAVTAYDVGPANALMDAAVADLTGGNERFDRDGERAARGTVHEDLLSRLLAEPYYAAPAPKSTGKELFHPGYVHEIAGAAADIGGDDLLATLAELTARTVADACHRHGVTDLVAAGGGVHNPVVMRRLAELLAPGTVRTIQDYGIAPTAKEAYLFALLGYLTTHGLPGVLPDATGARRPSVLGSITPGASGLCPTPAGSGQIPMPTRLVVAPS